MLCLSTAGIFDGRHDIYDDWDDLAQLSHNPRSKYMETILAARNPRRHLVCRAGWMMRQGQSKGKTFIQKLMSQIDAASIELTIEDNKPGRLAYTHDFARNETGLLDHEHRKPDNIACDGVTGRFGIAQEFMRLIGKDHSIALTPVSSALFAVGYLTACPASERQFMKTLDPLGCNSYRTGRFRLASILAVITMVILTTLHVVAGYE